MPPCKVRATKRVTTLRKMSSSLSEHEVANASKVMMERTDSMDSRAKEKAPFTDEELKDVINSLHNITPKDANIDWDALERLLAEIAHLSHKDWHVTGSNSDKMANLLLPDGGMTKESHQMFERILHEGNWDGALEHTECMSKKFPDSKPWAVLVTGVNGIRKTTSIYQPWFSKVLQEALVPPSSSENKDTKFDLEVLPNGGNSFFRQLDHMITTLCNENFSVLYALTGAQLENSDKTNNDVQQQKKQKVEESSEGEGDHPPKELIKQYSNLKASIFSRYRTLSELLGVLLLKQAQSAKINAMCETSGRDIAMFHYIDHFFPEKYHKLALHFTINDLSHAKESVDARMVREMKMGKKALDSGDVVNVIYANAGGPYGSEVLEGVQADSDRVWNEVVLKGEGGVGSDWYKATIRINARSDGPWTVQAVKEDGSLGTEYAFGDPRSV